MPSQAETSETIERIGDILRRARQDRGDDLQHIADYLCIRKGFLSALENSDYGELPADAYAIGFLRSYATYLGFDGAEAINRYRGEMAGRRRKPSLAMPTPIAEGRTPSAFIMLGAALAAILIYAAWYGFSSATRSHTSMAPPLPVTTTAVEPPSSPQPTAAVPPAPPPTNLQPPLPASDGIALAAPADAVAAPAGSLGKTAEREQAKAPQKAVATQIAAAAAPPVTVPGSEDGEPVAASQDSSRLTLRAEKETWVHVADTKDNTVYDKVMKPGDTYDVPDVDGLLLTTGNSGGITLVLDGKDLPRISKDSGVLHDFPLDISKLKTSKAKSAKATLRPQQ